MKPVFILTAILCAVSIGWAQSGRAPTQIKAEYYVTAYAQRYRVPVALARAIAGSWPLLITLAKTRSAQEALLTEIPMSSRTSEQLEQFTFEKRGLNQNARIPFRKEM
jgi:glycosyltransferase A (GT-A) superfamily protein (DUF2064 family)